MILQYCALDVLRLKMNDPKNKNKHDFCMLNQVGL